jgi:hypothetical protein
MSFARFKVLRAAYDAASKLLGVGLAGDGDEGDDAGAATVDDQAAQVLTQLGVAARPIVRRTLRALGVEIGDEVVVVKLWDKAATPTDLDAGETRLYACGDTTVALALRTDGVTLTAKGATVVITSNGDVQVTAASGRDITLNGGTKRIAREEDSLNVGTLVATAGPYPVLFTYVPGTVGAAPSPPPGGVALGGVILTGTGAAHAKG